MKCATCWVVAALSVGCGTSQSLSDAAVADAQLFDGSDGATNDTGGAECAPGETRVVDCGNCGIASQACASGGDWEPVGECRAQGECAPGTEDFESRERCDSWVRICDSQCEWSEFEQVSEPSGECSVGDFELRRAECSGGLLERRDCSESCEWVDFGECGRHCPGEARTEPALSEDVCVPEGTFVRGSLEFEDTQPVREIFISAFYIDRYPVTNARYHACVEAGVCTNPPGNPTGSVISNPVFANRAAVGLTKSQAVTFCEWDGGRRLPTEAEWEKAARGPAPRAQRFPWGDELLPCDQLPFRPGCEEWGEADHFRFWHPEDVHARPASESFYGVAMMMFGHLEWVVDAYRADFYGSAPDRDPLNADTLVVQVRGRHWEDVTVEPALAHLSDRTDGEPREKRRSLRCARSAE